MTLILMLMILMSILFLYMKHPLSMGMILLSQTLLISMITGLNQLNYWYSYILFIIMIGGMLILFMYMTSVASNEKFKFSSKIFMLMIISFLLMLSFKPEFLNLNMNMNFNNLNFSLNKYFNQPNNLISYLMFFYLLITMIMVTKITKIEKGPLRQLNK
uniref:NADH-ubiquinone oxidoreductase chain 6 n=1 Tax=Lema sp. LEM01 TaxID=1205561 RepID=A0A0S2MPI2_9CUCU|nr:NADH deshydrogenase subunit 6 [Lema sp. LEM01]